MGLRKLIKNRLSNKWEKKVRDYCDGQYQIIDVLPGEINYYYKCQLIATHYAVKNGHKKLALVMYREESSYLPCVHFLNFDGVNFIDNTIGEWSKTHEYRFIRWVSEKEFFSTGNILTDNHKFLDDMGGFFTRLICNHRK